MRLAIIISILLAATLSQAKTLNIGTPRFNPPFVMATDKDHYTGFDIDLTAEICRRISLKCLFKPLAYSEIFSALNAHDVDLAVGAIDITQERSQYFLFSLPYLQSYGQYMVRYQSDIHSLNEIPGKTLGVANSSIFVGLLKKDYHNEISVKLYDFHADMLSALQSGDVDILLLDQATAAFWFINSADNYQPLGNPIQVGYGYGIMANKGDDTLITNINKALLAMEADGTYLKIYNTYFSGGTP